MFFQRLCALSPSAISKHIFLQRLFQYRCTGRAYSNGFIDYAIGSFHSTGLNDVVEDYCGTGCFPSNPGWKLKVTDAIVNQERELHAARVSHDPDFLRFNRIHRDCFAPSILWVAAREVPGSLDVFHVAAELTVATLKSGVDLTLCDSCGCFFTDGLLHYVTVCPKYNEERERWWSFMVDNLCVELSAWLHNLEDPDLVDIMLGAPFPIEFADVMSDQEHYLFLYRTTLFLDKLKLDLL